MYVICNHDIKKEIFKGEKIVMKKYLTILIAILMVNVTLLAINPTEVKADNQQQTKNVDVVIVIDNSRSMSGEPWTDAVEAASNFTDQLKSGDRCAIYCFGPNNAQYNYTTSNYSNGWGNPQPRKLKNFTYTTSSGKTVIKNNLSALSPGGYTPLFDTIGAAMDYMVAKKRSNSVGAIVALTDGADNENEQFYPSHDYRQYLPISTYGEKRYGLLNFTEATFIIGLGIDNYSTYKSQLQNIANSSDGEYYSAANSSQLGAIYDKIAQKIDEERDSDEESFLDKWLIPLIILIIAVIAVAAILALLLRKKKPMYGQPPMGGYQQQQPPQQQQQAPPAAGVCPTCGKPMRFIQQYNRYWCDSCQQYK